MKKSSIKVAHSIKNLPSIKPKLIRTDSSKKKISTPRGNKDISLSPKVKEIIIPRTDESYKKDFMDSHVERYSKEKMRKLLNIIKDQDEYINSIETQVIITNQDFPVKTFNLVPIEPSIECTESSSSKNEELPEYLENYRQKQSAINFFLREVKMKNTLKEKEIEKLKQEVDESGKLIEENRKKSQKYLKKLKQCEANAEKLKVFEKSLAELKSEHELIMIDLKAKVETKKAELGMKISDIEELASILKKSEEKRFNVNKFKSFLETNSSTYIERIQELQKEKHQIQIEIQEVRSKIKSQQKTVDQLVTKLSDLQYKGEKLRETNVELNFKLEASKEELLKSQQRAEILKSEFETETKNLEDMIEASEKGETEEKILIRRATTTNKLSNTESFLTEYEIIQSSYFYIQNQLNLAKDTVDKLKKNEIYLKNQYQTKDTLIKQMEKLISNPENEPKKPLKIDEVTRNKETHLKELQILIDEIKQNYKEHEDNFKCVSCFKIPSNLHIIKPCSHLYCSSCKEQVQSLCLKCGETLKCWFFSSELNRLLKYFKLSSDAFTKMKKLLQFEFLSSSPIN